MKYQMYKKRINQALVHSSWYFVLCLLNIRKYDLFSRSPSNKSQLVTDILLQHNYQKKEA